MGSDASGKKVIFLYPPNMIEDISPELAKCEFEIAIARDHDKLSAYLKKHPDCLVYVNVDHAMKAADWVAWMRTLKAANPLTGFGVLTLNDNKDLAKTFLMDMGLTCGFIVIKVGAAKTAEILVKTLEAAEARGRRKYVRSEPGATGGEFNVSIHGMLERGQVVDVSSVGLAFILESGRSFPQGQIFDDMQLNLKGARLTVKVIIMGRREAPGEMTVHIGMFSPDSLDDVKRAKLRTYVQKTIQEGFERELG